MEKRVTWNSLAMASMLAMFGHHDWRNYTPVPRRIRNDSARLALANVKRERKNEKRLSDFRTMGLA